MRAPVRALLLTLALAAASGAAGDPQSQEQKPAPSPAPQAPPSPAGELQEFVPSERVRADESVAFPVDI